MILVTIPLFLKEVFKYEAKSVTNNYSLVFWQLLQEISVILENKLVMQWYRTKLLYFYKQNLEGKKIMYTHATTRWRH